MVGKTAGETTGETVVGTVVETVGEPTRKDVSENRLGKPSGKTVLENRLGKPSRKTDDAKIRKLFSLGLSHFSLFLFTSRDCAAIVLRLCCDFVATVLRFARVHEGKRCSERKKQRPTFPRFFDYTPEVLSLLLWVSFFCKLSLPLVHQTVVSREITDHDGIDGFSVDLVDLGRWIVVPRVIVP